MRQQLKSASHQALCRQRDDFLKQTEWYRFLGLFHRVIIFISS
jgi:hypothetical protein